VATCIRRLAGRDAKRSSVMTLVLFFILAVTCVALPHALFADEIEGSDVVRLVRPSSSK